MFRRFQGNVQGGVTLVEMLVTVTLVALAASLAIPSAAPVSSFAADAAAGEVARALRFARREAIRTSEWRVVRFEAAGQSLAVYSPAADSNTVASMAVHPIDKSPYKIEFGKGTGARGQLVVAEFKYEDNTVRNYVGFGPDGAPGVQDAAQTRFLKFSARIVMRHGAVERELAVQPFTGRVTP